jgi:phage tail sheath protein FI
MPATLNYPGVYIEELPSGVHTITGVSTSITAFVGSALSGPTDVATRIQSYEDYQRIFGALDAASTLGYSVQHYFQHGGSDAYIVRVAGGGALAATFEVPAESGAPLKLAATGPGAWADDLKIVVSYPDQAIASAADQAKFFTLAIGRVSEADATKLQPLETYVNLTVETPHPRNVISVLKDSALLRVESAGDKRPKATEAAKFIDVKANGNAGAEVTREQISAVELAAQRKGIYALDAVDLFNLLYLPPPPNGGDVDNDTLNDAAVYCAGRRALLIADLARSVDTTAADKAIKVLHGVISANKANVAVYFPRLIMADPLQQGRSAEFGVGGAVAGIMARTDSQRGVWKAPAGLDAGLAGVRELQYKLDDNANGVLNPLGLNCIRSFPVFGNVLWGARTLAGADTLASEWKYVPVRRFTLFIEESLYRGTQWAVFEPNDEPLWSQIRLNLGAFMHNLFVQGAFQGASPHDAYFVKCDKETTPQNAIDLGIVNIVVGFAPLKPAEFVVIKIQQIAGQIQV